MKRFFRWMVIVLALVFVGIQFVPIDRSNPPVGVEVAASTEVRAVLRRACYDCHSNETEWPWYSYIAPISWLVANDVQEGRGKMNYSDWNRMSAKKQAKRLHESWEEVAEGEMPLWFYLPLHPDAKLTEADKVLLKQWSQQGSGADPGIERKDGDEKDEHNDSD